MRCEAYDPKTMMVVFGPQLFRPKGASRDCDQPGTVKMHGCILCEGHADLFEEFKRFDWFVNSLTGVTPCHDVIVAAWVANAEFFPDGVNGYRFDGLETSTSRGFARSRR